MPDLLTAQQLAEYLQVSKRTVYRLVDSQSIPAVRVGAQWRFPKSEVDYWLDMRLSRLSATEFAALEADSSRSALTLGSALTEPNALIRVPAGSAAEVVRQFVARMELPASVDRELVTRRVLEREALCSTAMPGGVAVLHTARWMPRVLREHDLLSIGRVSEPIDFGALDGGRVDLMVLVLARNERNHLVLLTKITRLCQDPSFVSALRSRTSASQVVELVARFERAAFPPGLDGG